MNKTIKCGVRFCGGCNSRYERGAAYREIKEQLAEEIDFEYAAEGEEYDVLLVIGGCTNCCASYEQFKTRRGVIKMWNLSDLENTVRILRDFERN